MLATQTDLEHRYSADVVIQWTDDDADGIADSAIVTAALTKASAYVERRLLPAYPSVIPFDTDTVPDDIKELVLSITGYRLAGRKQAAAEQYAKEFEQAEADLTRMTEPGECLLFPDGTTVYAEGSAQAEPNTGAWSSMTGKTAVFSDDSLADF